MTSYDHDWQPTMSEADPAAAYRRCARCGAHRYAVLSGHTCRVPPPAPSLGDVIAQGPGDWLERAARQYRKG